MATGDDNSGDLHGLIPAPPPEWSLVLDAFSRLQQARGGDRQIGRKIPVWLAQSGFEVQAIEPQWMAQVTRPEPNGPAIQWEIERVALELDALYAAQLLTPEEWQKGHARFRDPIADISFQSNASLQIRAQRA